MTVEHCHIKQIARNFLEELKAMLSISMIKEKSTINAETPKKLNLSSLEIGLKIRHFHS